MAAANISEILFTSPKLQPKDRQGWQGFYPYYAGYPLSFVEDILRTIDMPRRATVLDPWNGSGTTTLASARCGFPSHGIDLNPVMLLVARARSLRAVDSDSIEPLLKAIESQISKAETNILTDTDPLLERFRPEAANSIRRMEMVIRNLFVSSAALNSSEPTEKMSPLAAFFYVSLFAVVRRALAANQTANPTWLRKSKPDQPNSAPAHELLDNFQSVIAEATNALRSSDNTFFEGAEAVLHCADTADGSPIDLQVDLVISSPPYCTRLDYATATEAELAVTAPLSSESFHDIRRRMLGTVVTPRNVKVPLEHWGKKCTDFLRAVRDHPSKASSGYYYRNHIDYFDKLDRSLQSISRSIKQGGLAIFVVQDSYYKDIHNDLPGIFIELSNNYDLHLRRREDFPVRTIMASKHKYVRRYRNIVTATECVLCFEKEA